MNEHSAKKRGRRAAASLALCVAFAMLIGGSPLGADSPDRQCVFASEASARECRLIPGGEPFGVRFYTKGAVIYRIAEGSPAALAGLLTGDLIEAVGEKEILSASEVSPLLLQNAGKTVRLTLLRAGKRRQVEVTPNGEGKIGVYVRDSLSGIGTVTFFDPATGVFGGLGHGICESGGGQLMPLYKGSVTDVRLTSAVKGAPGAPGQLRGLFLPGQTGTLTANTASGVFGKIDGMPEGKALPTAERDEVKVGKAQILCTVRDGEKQAYDVEIEKILSRDGTEKNYLVRVTDEELLSLVGGIVQGMSGSPILQNGRLVGAVTHVLLEDPTRGYGIYIGNMTDRLAGDVGQ